MTQKADEPGVEISLLGRMSASLLMWIFWSCGTKI